MTALNDSRTSLTAAETSTEHGRVAPAPKAPESSVPRSTRSRTPRLRLVLMSSDALAVLVSWLIVLSVSGDLERSPVKSIVGLGSLAVLTVLLASQFDLYLARVSTIRSVELAALIRIAVIMAVASVLIARSSGEHISFPTALAGAFASFVLLVACRSTFDAWIKERRRRGKFCRRVLLVGRDEASVELFELVEDQPELGYRIVGFVGPRDDLKPGFEMPWAGDFSSLEAQVAEREANGAIIAASALGELHGAITRLMQSGIHLQVSTGLSGIDRRRLRGSTVGYETVLYLERPSHDAWRMRVKRVIDVALATLGTIVALPFMMLAAAAIKLHDRGPILFRQERVGRNGQRFEVLKLRTMEIGAESKVDQLAHQNDRSGVLFKLENDPRVTPCGRLLRATSLDEFPQLINVLRGEMALVGPRPALVSEVQQFDDELQERTAVRPGITGLWQLEARDNPSFRVYRRLDLFYLRNWSLTLDFVILVSTVFAVGIRAVASATRFVTRRHVDAPLVTPGQPVEAADVNATAN